MARSRDYAAERAAARARGAALGLSPSAALGKPNKGERSRSSMGDQRTKAGRAAAEAIAAARGTTLPAHPTITSAAAGGQQVRTSISPRLLQGAVLSQLSPNRLVRVVVETIDPVTGARRTVEPWSATPGHGNGIRAGTLRQEIAALGGDIIAAIVDMAGDGHAGSTDVDALTSDTIESVTISYA